MSTIIGLFVGLLSGSILYVISRFPNVYLFFGGIVLWWVLLWLLDQRYKVERSVRIFQLITSVSCIVLLSLVARGRMQGVVALLSAIIFFVVWRWSALSDREAIFVSLKPLRRVVVAIWTFNVFSIATAIFALSVFFQNIPLWILAVSGALLGSYAAYAAWGMYYKAPLSQWAIWVAGMFLIMFELTWVIDTLPFGYLVLGVLLAWVWYVVHLLIRFHVSPQGILWKKQRWFLLGNGVLMGALIYLARWI